MEAFRCRRKGQYDLNNKLDLLEGLGEALQEADVTVETLLRNYFTLVGPPELTEKNYLYEQDNFSMIQDHLELACAQQTKGVNILVYGPPGTGKTYNTINKAIEIINPSFDLNQERSFVKVEYDRLVESGQIVFTTFHQSMSYEDFVEGIKPEPPKEELEQLSYKQINNNNRYEKNSINNFGTCRINARF
jgi:Cdc6-like AAA superfamily ATPase